MNETLSPSSRRLSLNACIVRVRNASRSSRAPRSGHRRSESSEQATVGRVRLYYITIQAGLFSVFKHQRCLTGRRAQRLLVVIVRKRHRDAERFYACASGMHLRRITKTLTNSTTACAGIQRQAATGEWKVDASRTAARNSRHTYCIREIPLEFIAVRSACLGLAWPRPSEQYKYGPRWDRQYLASPTPTQPIHSTHLHVYPVSKPISRPPQSKHVRFPMPL